jgi:hypothetical protein
MSIKVYRFGQYRAENDETMAHGFATMDFIILNKLTAVEDSEMDVDPSHVDAEGRYLGLTNGKST